MRELLNLFTLQDGVLLLALLMIIYCIGLYFCLKRTSGRFIERIENPRSYRMKTKSRFYEGVPDLLNKSHFHPPRNIIDPCVILVELYETDGFIFFEAKTNECKDSDNKLNGCTVYYDKDLFNNLDKIEIK